MHITLDVDHEKQGGFQSKKDAAVNDMTTNIEKLEEEKDSNIYCTSQFGSFKDFIHMLIHDESSKTGN